MIENKILLPEETELLREMIGFLAKYHNETAENNEITYPTGSIDDTIQTLSDNMAKGKSIIKAYFDNNTPIAFCCIGIHKEEKHGELKYLYVHGSYRKHGLGDALMQWAMEEFKKSEIDFIDIRVVIGNPASGFYEKYGFRPRITVMSKRLINWKSNDTD